MYAFLRIITYLVRVQSIANWYASRYFVFGFCVMEPKIEPYLRFKARTKALKPLYWLSMTK